MTANNVCVCVCVCVCVRHMWYVLLLGLVILLTHSPINVELHQFQTTNFLKVEPIIISIIIAFFPYIQKSVSVDMNWAESAR
jgi:hypothetical protein